MLPIGIKFTPLNFVILYKLQLVKKDDLWRELFLAHMGDCDCANMYLIWQPLLTHINTYGQTGFRVM